MWSINSVGSGNIGVGFWLERVRFRNIGRGEDEGRGRRGGKGNWRRCSDTWTGIVLILL